MPTVEVTWRGTKSVTTAALADSRTWASAHGYPVHIWGDVNRDQQLVTLMRVTTPGGYTVALYETSYTEENRS